MKLENQVCSLESAKRLKELGVNQESLFYWIEENRGPQGFQWYIELVPPLRDYPTVKPDYYSAFTVAELGEIFPPLVDIDGTLTSCEGTNNGDTTWKSYLQDGRGNKVKEFDAPTEAGARAKMLIYLLENNLIQS